MANLNIRKLNDSVYEQLRIRAVKHGVSMEEETRQIITQAVAVPEKLSTMFKKHFGKKNGVDLSEVLIRKPHHPMDFDE